MTFPSDANLHLNESRERGFLSRGSHDKLCKIYVFLDASSPRCRESFEIVGCPDSLRFKFTFFCLLFFTFPPLSLYESPKARLFAFLYSFILFSILSFFISISVSISLRVFSLSLFFSLHMRAHKHPCIRTDREKDR